MKNKINRVTATYSPSYVIVAMKSAKVRATSYTKPLTRKTAANKHYKIDVKENDGLAVQVSWKRKPMASATGNRIYFIRTNVSGTDEKRIWDIYNTIREIESVFRILKTDLSIRPIFHKNDEHTKAHLHLGILAYTVINTIRFRLKKHGLHHDWSNIVRIMNTQKVGPTTMNQRNVKQVYIRVCGKPNIGAQEIYSAI